MNWPTKFLLINSLEFEKVKETDISQRVGLYINHSSSSRHTLSLLLLVLIWHTFVSLQITGLTNHRLYQKTNGKISAILKENKHGPQTVIKPQGADFALMDWILLYSIY